MRPDMPEDRPGGNGDWRAEWRRLIADGGLRNVEADLEAAEVRILEELAADAPVAPPAPEPGRRQPARDWHPSLDLDEDDEDDDEDPLTAVAIAIINQGLTIPLGHGSVRLLEDRVMFGVALPIEEARALVAAWTELSRTEGDGTLAAPGEVAIASLLASLLDPLAMRMLGGDADSELDD